MGCASGAPIYFVAKQELFKNPIVGWFLNCLGAFPVRRGGADEDSVDTALALLERGRPVVIFPEGTRITAGSLGRPKRGVGRLALQSGAAVVPVAITGSEHARDGWKIKPVKVHLRFGPPLTYPRVDDPSPFLAGEVTERIWPCVGLQWEWLGGLPPLRTAAVVGAGSMGTAMANVLARAGPGCTARLPHGLPGRAPARVGREQRLPGGSATRGGGRAQGGDRDRVRRRGPRGARPCPATAFPSPWARSARA